MSAIQMGRQSCNYPFNHSFVVFVFLLFLFLLDVATISAASILLLAFTTA